MFDQLIYGFLINVAAAIWVFVSARKQQRAAEADHDFSSAATPVAWLGLILCFGFLVVPIYFWKQKQMIPAYIALAFAILSIVLYVVQASAA